MAKFIGSISARKGAKLSGPNGTSAGALALLVFMTVGFGQACSPVRFDTDQDLPSVSTDEDRQNPDGSPSDAGSPGGDSSSNPGGPPTDPGKTPITPPEQAKQLRLKDPFVSTEMNTPVEFIVELSSDDGSPRNLLLDASGNATATTREGRLDIVNAAEMRAKYSPRFNFRGDDEGRVYMKDAKGRLVEAIVRIQVGNPLTAIKPALAVRGTGCMMCHANLKSNVITDFGWGGDGRGHDFFFGRNTPGVEPRNGAIYGDHAENWLTAKLGGDVIVPKAPLGHDLSALGSTLADYMTRTLSKSEHESTRAAKVVEVASVHIGAPSVERIREVTGLKGEAATWIYSPDAGQPRQVSGLLPSADNRYVTNDPTVPLVCSGDLAIEGVVYLKRLKVQTTKGCRIYATRSVFIEGPIEYVGGSPQANLQIVSARSINLGLGQNTCGFRYQWGSGHPLYNRLKEMWTIPGYATREAGATPQRKADDIFGDALQIGTLVDAECHREGRGVGFERLILNAPHVNSRYKGNFKGTIIAEIAVMSLSAFSFEFDPVFMSVPVLPLLKTSDYLDVK